MDPAISLKRAWDEINRTARERYNEAPKATYDAVMFELRTYGLPQLKKARCQRRTADLSIAQLKKTDGWPTTEAEPIPKRFR